MGKLVAFWSPYTGRAKVTSSLCAIAGMFGAEYPEYSIAISHTGSEGLNLGNKIDCRYACNIKEEVYSKSGIASLIINCRQAVLTADRVRRSAIPLIMKSLYFYPNVMENYNNQVTGYILTELIPNEFDAVLLDVQSGFNACSKKYLKEADFVVVVLPQEPEIWKDYLLHEAEYLSEKKHFILLGGYLTNSRFSKTYYMRRNGEKLLGELMGGIPFNTGFFDAMAEGRALDFIYKNQRVRKKEENYEFIFQTKKIVDFLRKRILVPEFENKDTADASGLYRGVSDGSGLIGGSV